MFNANVITRNAGLMEFDAGTASREQLLPKMDRFVFKLLHMVPSYPIWLRYVLSLTLVGGACLGRLLAPEPLGAYPLLLFVPAVFLASVLFDRGSGFLATIASAVLASVFFLPRSAAAAAPPLIVFILTGFGLAGITEALRSTTESLAKAKVYSDVLLQELAHRTKNDLTTIVSMLRLQARADVNPEVQAALHAAIGRVEVIAKVHDRLHSMGGDGKILLGPYIETLCGSLGDLQRGVRPIAVRVRCDEISLASVQAANIGLIVNELVTNAFKYAFPNERAGAIDVDVKADERRLSIVVKDDGVGCPSEAKTGMGSRLIKLLAAQMKGSVSRSPLPNGCEVKVVLARDDR
ncbi:MULTISPECIES: sensor histidine kinase [Bradyrhizobium]|uniref:histidine kinase n=1 Tax=Bradyrhizobium elkanii TaxID=29448 RepID=A0A8I2C6L4_BRAEL|nr:MULTISPECIES: histidine kinase dimerization/phosphoacceptor domain -containing protein [Bradyrhizobium]MBP1294471.1 two-component sensor histidine kinase [Bradyrhizobium elkanii]MCP1925145.1 two-component sensor histidine kinase [Bradyrhizobium elkanii]MCS3477366.1 two-component sensor histidine kinase [Bradyrhizobium elkanii]MCS3584101.1 two-component sensor histidine kinase [Bradyrhizobium elkanii]MCS3717681.1 two-component sensor histidine kinase [Bradyrhizobium elkanii]